MGTLYENIVDLCNERNIKPGKMCAETGVSRGLITDLKMGRKNDVKVGTAQKIADYFGVSVDRVLGAETKKDPTPKGEVDDELLQIWNSADESDRQFLIETARMLKVRREQK